MYAVLWFSSYLNFTPAILDSLVDSTVVSMRTTLDNVAPLKRKVISQKLTHSCHRYLIKVLITGVCEEQEQAPDLC